MEWLTANWDSLVNIATLLVALLNGSKISKAL